MNHTKVVRPNKRGFLQAVGIDPDTVSVTRTIAEKMFDKKCGPYTNGDKIAENYFALCKQLKTRIDTINRQYYGDFSQQNPCDMVVALCLDYSYVTNAIKHSKYQETRDIALNMCLNIANFLENESPQQAEFDNQNPFAKFIIVSILTQRCKDHNEKLDRQHKSNETGYVADYNEVALDTENSSLRRFSDINFRYRQETGCGHYLNIWMERAKKDFIYRKTNPRRIELSL